MSDYFTSQYAGMNAINPADAQSILDFYARCSPYYTLELKPYLPLLSDQQHVLDIGCGIGGALYYLQQLGFQHLSGVDSSEAQLNIARKYVSAQFTTADILEFFSSVQLRYSLILCFDLIEHLPKEKIPVFLKELRNHLHEEGSVIIRTPNMGLPISPFFRYNDFTHATGFTEYSIKSVLHDAGFSDITVSNAYIGKRRKAVLEFIQKAYSKLYNTPLGACVTTNLVAVAHP